MLLSKRLVSGTVGSEYVLQDIVGFLLYQLVRTLRDGGEGGKEEERKKRKESGNDAADGNNFSVEVRYTYQCQ